MQLKSACVRCVQVHASMAVAIVEIIGELSQLSHIIVCLPRIRFEMRQECQSTARWEGVQNSYCT